MLFDVAKAKATLRGVGLLDRGGRVVFLKTLVAVTRIVMVFDHMVVPHCFIVVVDFAWYHLGHSPLQRERGCEAPSSHEKNNGTLGHWDTGKLGNWDIGTLGHCDIGKWGHWDNGTLAHMDTRPLGRHQG